MTRLPSIGGDDGNWGEILNDYLSQAHNADGSLKPVAQSNITGLGSTLGGKQSTATLDADLASKITGGSATPTAIKQLLRTEAQKAVPTFGDLYHPYGKVTMPSGKAQVTFSSTPPAWWATNVLVRWDADNSFTHSQVPVPYGTYGGSPVAAYGCEYHAGSYGFKNLDIEFIVTGKKFAIRYFTFVSSDAMLWIDNEPVSLEPITGWDDPGFGSWNWIIITFPTYTSAKIRFSGPEVFTGIDYASADPVTVRPAPAPFTLGVVSDSYYEGATDVNSRSRSPAPMLRSYTGFRIWNMAQGGTGYVNDGGSAGANGYILSEYGSDARIAMLADAPIDALLVNGTGNDGGLADQTTYIATVRSFFQKVAQVRPDLVCVVMGVEPVSWFRGSGGVTLNNWLQAAIADQPNVVGFIDPYNEQWLTGTGAINNPQSDGNQDWLIATDGVHPNGIGNVWYQQLVADRLAAFPSQLIGLES